MAEAKKNAVEVTLLKRTGGKISVEWDAPGPGKQGGFVRDCKDEPSEAFEDALEQVRLDLLRRSPVANKHVRETLRLNGVSVSRSSSGHRQFVASATVDWGWGETGVALPLLRERVDSEDGKSILSDVELKHVEALLDEALAYARAKRAQGDLFDDAFGDDDEASETADAEAEPALAGAPA